MCEDHGLRALLLPNFPDTCDTYAGEHGADAQETVKRWYHACATPQQIHRDGDPSCASTCRYEAAWDFDPEDYHVLIGHPMHLYHEDVVQGRTVVIDEVPADAFEWKIRHARCGYTTARAGR